VEQLGKSFGLPGIASVKLIKRYFAIWLPGVFLAVPRIDADDETAATASLEGDEIVVSVVFVIEHIEQRRCAGDSVAKNLPMRGKNGVIHSAAEPEDCEEELAAAVSTEIEIHFEWPGRPILQRSGLLPAPDSVDGQGMERSRVLSNGGAGKA